MTPENLPTTFTNDSPYILQYFVSQILRNFWVLEETKPAGASALISDSVNLRVYQIMKSKGSPISLFFKQKNKGTVHFLRYIKYIFINWAFIFYSQLLKSNKGTAHFIRYSAYIYIRSLQQVWFNQFNPLNWNRLIEID